MEIRVSCPPAQRRCSDATCPLARWNLVEACLSSLCSGHVEFASERQARYCIDAMSGRRCANPAIGRLRMSLLEPPLLPPQGGGAPPSRAMLMGPSMLTPIRRMDGVSGRYGSSSLPPPPMLPPPPPPLLALGTDGGSAQKRLRGGRYVRHKNMCLLAVT